MLQLGRCPALFQKLRQRCAEPCSCSLGTVSKETGSLSCREWLMLRSSHSGRDRRNGPTSSSKEGWRRGRAKQVLQQTGRFGASRCLAPWIPVLSRAEGDRPRGTCCPPAHAMASITVTGLGRGRPGRGICGTRPQHAGVPLLLSLGPAVTMVLPSHDSVSLPLPHLMNEYSPS